MQNGVEGWVCRRNDIKIIKCKGKDEPADLKRLLRDTLNVKYNLFANPDLHKPV